MKQPDVDLFATATFGPPPRMRRQAKFMAIGNVIMRRLLALPFPTPMGRRLMLLTVTGRRTGKVYRQPISYVRAGDTLLTPGGGRWKLNLEPDRPVLLRIRGRDHTATPRLIDAPHEVARLLGLIVAASPVAAKFMPIPMDHNNRPDMDAVTTAIGYGFRVVEWTLNTGHAESANAAQKRSS